MAKPRSLTKISEMDCCPTLSSFVLALSSVSVANVAKEEEKRFIRQILGSHVMYDSRNRMLKGRLCLFCNCAAEASFVSSHIVAKHVKQAISVTLQSGSSIRVVGCRCPESRMANQEDHKPWSDVHWHCPCCLSRSTNQEQLVQHVSHCSLPQLCWDSVVNDRSLSTIFASGIVGVNELVWIEVSLDHGIEDHYDNDDLEFTDAASSTALAVGSRKRIRAGLLPSVRHRRAPEDTALPCLYVSEVESICLVRSEISGLAICRLVCFDPESLYCSDLKCQEKGVGSCLANICRHIWSALEAASDESQWRVERISSVDNFKSISTATRYSLFTDDALENVLNEMCPENCTGDFIVVTASGTTINIAIRDHGMLYSPPYALVRHCNGSFKCTCGNAFCMHIKLARHLVALISCCSRLSMLAVSASGDDDVDGDVGELALDDDAVGSVSAGDHAAGDHASDDAVVADDDSLPRLHAGAAHLRQEYALPSIDELRRIPEPAEGHFDDMTLEPSDQQCSVCGVHSSICEWTSKAVLLLTHNGPVVVRTRSFWHCNVNHCYRRFEDGVFAFGNKLLVTMSLLVHWYYLAMESNCDVSSQFKAYQLQHQDQEFGHRLAHVKLQTIRDCFCTFLSLLKDDLQLVPCVLCGFNPPIIVVDASFKAAFNLNLAKDVVDPTDALVAAKGRITVEEADASVDAMLDDMAGLCLGIPKSRTIAYDSNVPIMPAASRGSYIVSTEYGKLPGIQDSTCDSPACASDHTSAAVAVGTSGAGAVAFGSSVAAVDIGEGDDQALTRELLWDVCSTLNLDVNLQSEAIDLVERILRKFKKLSSQETEAMVAMVDQLQLVVSRLGLGHSVADLQRTINRGAHEDVVRRLDEILRLLTGSNDDDLGNKVLSDIRKQYRSYQFSSGGVICGMCPHGITYYTKPLIRKEGARDVLDLIRSFAVTPKLVIYDNISAVIAHSRKVLSRQEFVDLWGPHNGTLLPFSSESLVRAENSLTSSTPLFRFIPEVSNSYGLYDRFHQTNSKKRSAILRRVDLIFSLKVINTQVCEQTNALLKKKLSSWTQMRVDSFKLHLRAFVAYLSRKRNRSLLKELQTVAQDRGGSVASLNDGSLFVHLPQHPDLTICNFPSIHRMQVGRRLQTRYQEF